MIHFNWCGICSSAVRRQCRTVQLYTIRLKPFDISMAFAKTRNKLVGCMWLYATCFATAVRQFEPDPHCLLLTACWLLSCCHSPKTFPSSRAASGRSPVTHCSGGCVQSRNHQPRGVPKIGPGPQPAGLPGRGKRSLVEKPDLGVCDLWLHGAAFRTNPVCKACDMQA